MSKTQPKTVTTKETLVIVESPAKCKKIEEYLGAGYKCLASFGHIRELKNLNSIQFGANKIDLIFQECESKAPQIKLLKTTAKRSKEVIIATDDDREGEAIGWHLCQVLGLPLGSTKRMVFHEITREAINLALRHLRTINLHLVQAQLTRQVVDMLIGFNISPVLWRYVKNDLSAGRCQTPALRLVYDNQKLIDSSPGEMVYTITGIFTSLNLPFTLTRKITTAPEVEEFLQQQIKCICDYIYLPPTEKELSRPAPMPLVTSTLQQAASSQLRMSPKETMSVCQRLYEAGYITYMRTDSTVLSAGFKTVALAYLSKQFGPEYVQPLNDEASEDAGAEEGNGGAHEAIRPTNVNVPSLTHDTAFTKRDDSLYQLIYKQTLQSLMMPQRVNTLKARVQANPDTIYEHTAEYTIFAGWSVLDLKSPLSISKAPAYTFLKQVQANSRLPYKQLQARVSVQESHSHYTDARLVHMLEKQGIGRPSTFASIVDKLYERKYVTNENLPGRKLAISEYDMMAGQKELIKTSMDKVFGAEKNKLCIADLGKVTLDFLLHHFATVFDYEYTATMEAELDKIAQGQADWYQVCVACRKQVHSLTAALKVDDKTVNPKFAVALDEHNTYMFGKYGAVIKSTYGHGEDAQVYFKPAQVHLDMAKLTHGELELSDVVDASKKERNLGVGMNEQPVLLKFGKYGYYLVCGDVHAQVKADMAAALTLDQALELLQLSLTDSQTSKIKRVIDANTSIRDGRFGHYLFYQTPKMRKPKFFKLKDAPPDYLNCPLDTLIEWVKTQTGR